MAILIPTWFIPVKPIDYEGEVLQFLGQSRRFGKLVLPAPFCCYYSVLELFSSRFFLEPGKCEPEDVGKALYVLANGKKALDMVVSSLWGDKAFEKAGLKFYRRHERDILAFYAEIVQWVLCLPSEGFDMLPGDGGGGGKPFWFDAEYLAWIVSVVSQNTNEPVERILWHTPFLTAGHLVAAHCKANGVKNVERKADAEILKREMQAAAERESRGELHPWQIKHPGRYPPTKRQVDARIEILKEWEELKNADKHPGKLGEREEGV